MLTYYEFGQENKQTIVLIHPFVVFWDYFMKLIPLLLKQYHVIVPAMPGYDTKKPRQDFTGIEDIASGILSI